MIDRKFRVVVPEGGRMKTGSEQASPLTDRALEILDELKKEKDLQREDVAKAFGLLQDGNTDKDKEEVESQVVDFREGEGRCPVVPLVFKTSLGVVRSPEGSTPSLLRQNQRDQQLRHGQDRSRQLLILKRLAKGKKTVVELDQLHLFIIPIGRRNLHPLTF